MNSADQTSATTTAIQPTPSTMLPLSVGPHLTHDARAPRSAATTASRRFIGIRGYDYVANNRIADDGLIIHSSLSSPFIIAIVYKMILCGSAGSHYPATSAVGLFPFFLPSYAEIPYTTRTPSNHFEPRSALEVSMCASFRMTRAHLES